MDCGNILDYCSLDEDGKLKVLTLGEKEQQFLDACSVRERQIWVVALVAAGGESLGC